MHTKFPDGFSYRPEYLDRVGQQTLMGAVTQAVRGPAPFFQGRMPRTGQAISVVGSNFGPLGWVADIDGYHYAPLHPKTDKPWRHIQLILLDICVVITWYAGPTEACIFIWYSVGYLMGIHVVREEQDVNAPIVSISLGDPARYRLGGQTRGGKTFSLKLSSGDVVVLAGEARKCYHGVDKIFYGQSTLVPKGGRINLTLRRVNKV